MLVMSPQRLVYPFQVTIAQFEGICLVIKFDKCPYHLKWIKIT
jgi:hypothetical protein